MIATFDTGVNFWSVNPDMKVIEPFKSIYEDDKTKKKEDSSLLMWFIVLCYDRESKFYRLPPEEKHELVGSDFCGDIKYYTKWKLIIDAGIDMYIKLQYTPLERHLKTWEDLLNKRTLFLKDQEYDLGTYDALDKMAVGTKKVYDTIKSIVDDLAKEDSDGTAKGGAKESLND